MAGRVLHAQLHLLDRQVVSRRDGRLLGKVDDLELDLAGDVPHVRALLSGPAAWGHRLPGLLGALVSSVHRRLHPLHDPDPNVIPAARIVDVTSAVQVDSGDNLDIEGFGTWVDEQIICRIPGSGHATE
jgi:hypothetical protein